MKNKKLQITFVLFLIFISCQEYSPQPYIDEGMNRFKRGDYKGAIEIYNEVISRSPEIADVYLYRGEAKFELEDDKGAIQDYTKAIELNSSFIIRAHKNRLISRIKITDAKGALQDSKILIEKNPTDVTIVHYLTEVIDIEPKNADSYYTRGFAKEKILDLYGAIQDFDQAIEINPNYAEAFYYRGYTFYQLKNYKSAISDYTAAISIKPKYSDAYFNRGIAKFEIEDKKGGCLDLSRAGELGKAEAYNLIRRNCQD